MYSRDDMKNYHRIHCGIHQNGNGANICSIQCHLEADGPYHDELLEDGTIMYIGEGGLKKPQQEVIEKLNKKGRIHRSYGNLALKNASVTRKPFHVINKHKDGSYEYLGQWTVTRYEYSPLKGYPAHFRFFLNRVAPPEEHIGSYGQRIEQIYAQRHEANSTEPPARNYVGGMRVMRDNQLVEELKRAYGHTCMICQQPLTGVSVPIAEVHHIKPLGNPHNGPDVKENMLVLCPNHHAQFDAGVLGFAVGDQIVDHQGGRICSSIRSLHRVGPEFLEYHNAHIFKGNEQAVER